MCTMAPVLCVLMESMHDVRNALDSASTSRQRNGYDTIKTVFAQRSMIWNVHCLCVMVNVFRSRIWPGDGLTWRGLTWRGRPSIYARDVVVVGFLFGVLDDTDEWQWLSRRETIHEFRATEVRQWCVLLRERSSVVKRLHRPRLSAMCHRLCEESNSMCWCELIRNK